MIKVFNENRLRRMRASRERAERRSAERAKLEREAERSYTQGSRSKNANLMLDALALPLRRKIIARLRRGGAMSLSMLSEPFHITLPTALFELRALERAGILSTRKQGRTRICFYRTGALEELAAWLVSNGFQRE